MAPSDDDCDAPLSEATDILLETDTAADTVSAGVSARCGCSEERDDVRRSAIGVSARCACSEERDAEASSSDVFEENGCACRKSFKTRLLNDVRSVASVLRHSSLRGSPTVATRAILSLCLVGPVLAKTSHEIVCTIWTHHDNFQPCVSAFF